MSQSEHPYYPVKLSCDVPGCKHHVVGQSEKHVKDKIENHKKTKYCKGYKS